MFFIGLLILIALLGYLITPDPTPFANQQFLELAVKKPGFSVKVLRVYRPATDDQNRGFFRTMLFGKPLSYQLIPFESFSFSKDEIQIIPYREDTEEEADTIRLKTPSILYELDNKKPVRLTGDQISFYDHGGRRHSESLIRIKNEILDKRVRTKRYLLGSDRYGRDMLSQLMIGTRISLAVGFISVGISLLIGMVLGAAAGYFRGRTDQVIVWLINVVWSVPTFLLVIAITFVLGKGFWQVFFAIGLTMWVEVARVVRGQVLSLREKEYIQAARALGYRNSRIIFRHVIPNVSDSVIVISSANFASAILMEAGLSFLGLGVRPPIPSWGTMIKENYSYIILDAAYLAILPGLAIMITVLAFMILGNGLRDSLDVKTT